MKLAKLSLAAVVAVGALTTANAGSLEAAVKNTDLKGYARYRMNKSSNDAAGTKNEYKIVLKTSSKVNDDVKFNTKIAALTPDVIANQQADNRGVDFGIKDAYFTYTGVEGLTVQAGKQGLPGPFTDASDQSGTGAVALYNAAEGVTIAAGKFLNSTAETGIDGDAVGGADINEVGVIGSVEGVNAQAWYVNVNTTGSEEVTGFAVLADTKVAVDEDLSIGVAAAYASVDKEELGATKNTQSRIVLTGEMSGVNLALGYAMSDEDGGDVTFGDEDAAANFYVEQANMANSTGGKAIYVAAGTKIVDNVKAKLEYVTVGDYTKATSTDASEVKASACYKMSKNFKVSGYYSVLDVDGASKSKEARLELKYTF